MQGMISIFLEVSKTYHVVDPEEGAMHSQKQCVFCVLGVEGFSGQHGGNLA